MGAFHVDDVTNYSTGSLPANSDDLFVDDPQSQLLYGTLALSSISLATLTLATGVKAGLPRRNPLGYVDSLSAGVISGKALYEAVARACQARGLSVGTPIAAQFTTPSRPPISLAA